MTQDFLTAENTDYFKKHFYEGSCGNFRNPAIVHREGSVGFDKKSILISICSDNVLGAYIETFLNSCLINEEAVNLGTVKMYHNKFLDLIIHDFTIEEKILGKYRVSYSGWDSVKKYTKEGLKEIYSDGCNISNYSDVECLKQYSDILNLNFDHKTGKVFLQYIEDDKSEEISEKDDNKTEDSKKMTMKDILGKIGWNLKD